MPTKIGEPTKAERERQHAEEKCKLVNEIFTLKRQLQIATRQWENWKTEATRLNTMLQKYEPGSPMILNSDS